MISTICLSLKLPIFNTLSGRLSIQNFYQNNNTAINTININTGNCRDDVSHFPVFPGFFQLFFFFSVG